MVQVDLITGFLGAGKTTFLRRYAAWWAGQGVKVCVLENDFGAVNVDAMLLQDLEAQGVELETISGGCDCDTHQRRMRTKLISMAMRGFERVIVEPSGIFDVDEFFDVLRDEPLFEYSEQEGRWMAMHHPFTLPKAEDIDKVETDPGACHAVAYDIVLNGVEMGGGSMRINDPALQDRMFKALGFTEEKARESFGFLMDAYKFGAPPHGGMAYGLDRMVMLMLKKDSIRDVIAFPKVQNAGEPMSGAPDIVDPQQLKDLSIALTLTE